MSIGPRPTTGRTRLESDSSLSALALALSLTAFAIVALAEASIATVRRDRVQTLASQGASGSGYLERLHSTPTGPVGALSLVRVATFSASLVSASALAVAVFGVRWTPLALVTLAQLAFLGVVQTAAGSVAKTHAEAIALRLAPLARGLAWTLGPVMAVYAWGRTAGRLDRGDWAVDAVGEIDLPIESAGEPLDEHEVKMIRGVVSLDQTEAREIMVPRVDMVAVEAGTSIGEVAGLMLEGAHSRIPVYRGDLDYIEGIAYARDILGHTVSGEGKSETPVESVVRPALFIPESKTLEELLNEFQESRVHMAIVVDEYGGVSGLVTIEDLLEEIVGEIQDEFDVGEPEIEVVGDGEYVMDARVSIDQFSELLSVTVEGNGFDTLGGFVYQQLGRIPSPGDAVEHEGLEIQVISTVGRRLKRLRVIKAAKPADDDRE